MMISPLRIFMLYRQEGLVQTQALYSMEAPWLPKSESGTRSPSPHLRHRGKAFSTKSPPSLSLEDSIHPFCPMAVMGEEVSRGGASAAASASPQHVVMHAVAIIPQMVSCVSIFMKNFSSFTLCNAHYCHPETSEGLSLPLHLPTLLGTLYP